APWNLYDTPSVVPPYGIHRPAPSTDVTSPGSKVRRCVPTAELRSPSTIVPSGARSTPPCSTSAAARRKVPKAEYGTAGSAAPASPARPVRPAVVTPRRQDSDPFHPGVAAIHPQAGPAVPLAPSNPPFIRRVAIRRRREDIYLQGGPRAPQPKSACGLLIQSDRSCTDRTTAAPKPAVSICNGGAMKDRPSRPAAYDEMRDSAGGIRSH
ncbi:hypothetical protein OY671_009446, partial [Metschnikowia pulcherrima]